MNTIIDQVIQEWLKHGRGQTFDPSKNSHCLLVTLYLRGLTNQPVNTTELFKKLQEAT